MLSLRRQTICLWETEEPASVISGDLMSCLCGDRQSGLCSELVAPPGEACWPLWTGVSQEQGTLHDVVVAGVRERGGKVSAAFGKMILLISAHLHRHATWSLPPLRLITQGQAQGKEQPGGSTLDFLILERLFQCKYWQQMVTRWFTATLPLDTNWCFSAQFSNPLGASPMASFPG